MKGSPVLLLAGILLILAGTVWILQGFDIAFAPQSFMTDNPWWVLWGGLGIVAGAVLIWRSVRS